MLKKKHITDKELLKKLAHKVRDKTLFDQNLRHRSFCNRNEVRCKWEPFAKAQAKSEKAILCQERKKLKIIRPLLDFKRESITMVCKDLQIPVYPDKSNRSVQYSRNRIRKQIIPSIKHFINPQVESSLFKVAQLLQKEQFFVYSLLRNTSVHL